MHPVDIAMLVDTHGTAVYRFCRKLACNKPDADDLYQETFLKALELIHKIDGDKNPQAFLISCSINIWKSSRRKYAHRQNLAPTVELTEAACITDRHDVEETVISNAESDALKEAVDILDDKFRIPLYLYYTLEMDISEIAGALKIPPGTVKSRLHKARATIKKRLEAASNETPRFRRSTI